MTRHEASPQALLLDRLVAQGHEDAPWALLVLAACDGAPALARYLDDGIEPARPARREETAAGQAAREAPRAYLEAVSVRGFRGIGPERTLALTPGPGLTLVIGRNGSGKSSFAEAVEVLFTGDSVRWSAKGSRFWKEGWRNLHEGLQPALRATLDVEGLGRVELTRTWADGVDVEAGVTTVARPGTPPCGLSEIGWDVAVGDYRPFMPHSELESLFDEGPSKLYRALLKGLGLDAFELVRKTLAEGQSARKRQREDVREAARRITAECEQQLALAADDRIVEAKALLSKRDWDLDRLSALATGTVGDQTSLVGLLADAARASGPDRETVRTLVEALRSASAAVHALATQEAGRANDLSALLEQALSVTAQSGRADCPVCQTPNVITGEWRQRTEVEARRLRGVARELQEAQRSVTRLVRQGQDLCGAPPHWLADERWMAGPATVAREAWQRWHQGRALDGPDALAAHLEQHSSALTSAVEALTAWAAEELRQRQDVWQPIAVRLAPWVASARRAVRGHAQVASLKTAEEWVKGAIDDLRNERFRPIAGRAVENWSLIRLQSNVDLTAIELEGAGKAQSVDLRVTVDGKEAGALGVMSQGELNALALSLFLPRASLPESPFGFVIVDDPVQAMDPARVEGLARVLEQTARTRQVIVFTHDDRLPEAVRRLQIEARMVEVLRRANSVVEVRPKREPVDAYLDDARALMIAARDGGLPDGVVVRVVPGFCRAAIEAACTEVIRRRRLGRGDRHMDVEELLEDSKTLNKLMALALFDDGERAGEVARTIRNKWEPWAEAVFKSCQSGAHGEFVGDLDRLVQQTGSFTGRVRKLA